MLLQISCLVVCAVAQGTAFVRWRNWSAEEKRNSWRLYGWFTALSSLGSVAGALGYAARMGQLYYTYVAKPLDILKTPTLSELQLRNEMRADRLGFIAAFYSMFPLELGLVVVAKLLVLHRLHRFSICRSPRVRMWEVLGRLFLAAVVAGNLIGFGGNIVSAVYYSQAGGMADKAAKAWAANDTAVGKNWEGQSRQKTEQASAVASVQRFSEVSVLLMIISAFLIVGVNSLRIIAQALRTLLAAEKKFVSVAGAAGAAGREMIAGASVQGRQLQVKVVATVAFVFFTVLVRTAFTVLYALAQGFQNSSSSCAPSQCDPCKNVYTHINFFILYTPLFQLLLMLVSSPLALLVALWGMSGVRAIEHMSSQLLGLDQARQNSRSAHTGKRDTGQLESGHKPQMQTGNRGK